MRSISLFLIFLINLTAFAQETASLKGHIYFEDTNAPAANVIVRLGDSNFITETNTKGTFEFKGVPFGSYEIVLTSIEIKAHQQLTHISNTHNEIRIGVQRMMHNLNEVQIRQKTEKRDLETRGFAVNIIETKEVATRNFQTNEILDQSAGIRVRQNGGMGSSVNYNLNGMSGGSVRIFIDGIPISTYGSSFSLNSIPPSNIERIEVYKGVIPAHLADDALGGAINVILKKGMNNSLTASMSYGSFNTFQANVNGMFRNEKNGFTVKASAFHNSSDNDYEVWGKFVRNVLPNGRYDYVRAKRFNDAYRSTGGQLEVGFTDVKWADHFFLGINASKDYNEIQHGTYMSVPYKGRFTESNSNVVSLNYRKRNFLVEGLELTFSGMTSSRKEVVTDTVKWNYNWFGELATGLYGEPILRPSGAQQAAPTINHINRDIYTARGGINYDITENHRIVVNYMFNKLNRKEQDFMKPELEREFLGTRNLDKNVTSVAYETKAFDNRFRSNVFVKLYNQNVYKVDPIWVETNGERIKQERESKSNKKSTGYGLAFSYAIKPTIYILTSAEKAVRLPSESEIFGDPGENVVENFGIRPEVSNNANLGIKLGPFKNNIHRYSFGATVFVRDTRDKITRRVNARLNDAVQTDPFENLGKVMSKGFEAEANYTYNNNLNIGFNLSKFNTVYNVQYDENGREYEYYNRQLPNEPYFTANTTARYRIKDVFATGGTVNLHYSLRFVERFYTTWLLIDSFRTPRQYIQDLGVSYVFPNKKFILSADVKNMFDKQAYDNFAVQKPGRAFYLKLNYSINKF